MASIAPPTSISDLPSLRAAALPSEQGPAAQAAQQRMAEHKAELRSALAPNSVHVSLDEDAQRFVQTVTDPNTAQTVLRYPSESQLAYARAVMAYLRAMSQQ
ncbi:MAG: hypothetical protein AB7O98_09365 [Hyphomonadaceae bacterium]